VSKDRDTRRETIVRALWIGAVGCAALGWAAWVVVRGAPLPPRSVVMATGPGGGAYAALGERYREALARRGLAVVLRTTQGDGENRTLLDDPRSGVAVAFLQSGTTTADASPDLASLGAVFQQPLWVFRRGPAAAGTLALQGLSSKRLAAGGESSGTRAVVLRLLALSGVEAGSVRLLPLSPADGADALLRGEIDAAAMVASWDSPAVRRLLGSPQVGLDGFPRADAYVALDPSLQKLVLPAGVGDMARGLPPADVPMLALTVSLVVREDLHPAVQYMLLEAATEIHGGPGIFQRPGQFPAAESVDLPLADDARHFYRSGRPFLQRYLPYWAAVMAERLLLVLLPILGLLLPLVRIVPSLYDRIMQRRIIRLYGELKVLEAELGSRDPADSTRDLADRLGALEVRARHLRVPLRYSQMLYTLKQHVEMVRGRLRGGEAAR
jgi:TRAP-type uncharacterized transport system substrate-binding protein